MRRDVIAVRCRRLCGCLVAGGLMAASPASAAPEPSTREAAAPLSIEVDVDVDQAPEDVVDLAGTTRDDGRDQAPSRPPPPRIDAGEGPLRVAVGLGPGAPGGPMEKNLLATLEASVRASPSPQVEVRRLRPGGGEGRVICRDGQEDLVILVDYLGDQEEPALLPHDCALDRPLGVRSGRAAGETGLVAALWREHVGLVQDGAQTRRAGLGLSPRARRGLIAGSAIAAVAAAVAVVLAASLRSTTAVITVSR
jgi:hypothetical protein